MDRRLITRGGDNSERKKVETPEEQVYLYSWGDEDLLAAEIRIIKKGDIYTITFTQNVFNERDFVKLEIPRNLLNRNNTIHTEEVFEGCFSLVWSEIIVIKDCLNPKPESLFMIVDD